MDSRNRMLWVGNLSERTKEEILYELFLQVKGVFFTKELKSSVFGDLIMINLFIQSTIF